MIYDNVEETLLTVHLLDNSVYFVKKVGGEKGLLTRGVDNNHHVEGKLTVASKEEVKELFSAIVPILKAGRRLQGPLGRCWRTPCCSNLELHTNYQDSGYLWELGNLQDLRVPQGLCLHEAYKAFQADVSRLPNRHGRTKRPLRCG